MEEVKRSRPGCWSHPRRRLRHRFSGDGTATLLSPTRDRGGTWRRGKPHGCGRVGGESVGSSWAGSRRGSPASRRSSARERARTGPAAHGPLTSARPHPGKERDPRPPPPATRSGSGAPRGPSAGCGRRRPPSAVRRLVDAPHRLDHAGPPARARHQPLRGPGLRGGRAD